MKRKSFLQLIILFLSVFFSVNAQAAISEKEAKDWALQKGEQIIQILGRPTSEEKFAALDKILYEDIDLEHAAKFVVGRYWRQMTPQQQQTYVLLFKRYVSSLYKAYPLDLKIGDISYTVDKVLPNKDTMEVWCTIKLSALEDKLDKSSQGGFQVLFVLVQNDGRLQVRDLKISESSLLLSFRDRFVKMIHVDSDDEIDWFLEDLEAIVRDNEQKNAQNLEMAEN